MRAKTYGSRDVAIRDPLVEAGLVLAFAPRAAFDAPDPIGALRRAFPRANVVACSTAGQIFGDELVDDETIVVALAFETTDVCVAAEPIAGPEASRACGAALGRRLARPGLAGVLVIADGLLVNGNELVEGVVGAVGPGVTVAGGMAADGDAFVSTRVLVDGDARPGLVAGVGFHGAAFRMRTGIGDGWQVFGPRRRVTRSDGNRVYELDGEPILDLYRRYLDDEDFAGLPRAGLLFPLQISSATAPDHRAIRAVLGLDRDDGAMIFGGDIPVGSVAQLMRGTSEGLVDGAARAARRVVETAGDLASAGSVALLISCVGRRLLMGSRIEDEILSVAEILGDVPRAGFYSLGEICPFLGSTGVGLHNETMTIVTFSEEA